jgi:hypothetical protein
MNFVRSLPKALSMMLGILGLVLFFSATGAREARAQVWCGGYFEPGCVAPYPYAYPYPYPYGSFYFFDHDRFHHRFIHRGPHFYPHQFHRGPVHGFHQGFHHGYVRHR